mmetsp:Transcript_23119/g.37119  ORF Transcript_23119/g.37119 Transcript_23119/m.37119 type:complete len:206 (-) Transcript_23119:260-877(-)
MHCVRPHRTLYWAVSQHKAFCLSVGSAMSVALHVFRGLRPAHEPKCFLVRLRTSAPRPWRIFSTSPAAARRGKPCPKPRARWRALVAENVFFESFILSIYPAPLEAGSCSSVLDATRMPQIFSGTVARLFRTHLAHPRAPPSVDCRERHTVSRARNFGCCHEKRSKRTATVTIPFLNGISERVNPYPPTLYSAKSVQADPDCGGT